MNDYSMYRFFKGEKKNPFDQGTQNPQHMFWFYESIFEIGFSKNESSDWYDFFGGKNSKTAQKFMKILSEEDYERPAEKKKAVIFDIWLNDYLFIDKLYDEYSGGKTNSYKDLYYATFAR